ncbi:hypothetical protein GBAR_LOCUS17624, partial [Geodia barretti]
MSYISAHLGRLTTGHAYFYSYIIRPYVTCTFGNKFWKPCFIKMPFPWSCFKIFSVLNRIIVEEASKIFW